MNKQKIYLVPHTHWDREWMFSEQTGNVLLNQMMNEMLGIIKKDSEFKLVLDGQASLVDDYLKFNPGKINEFIKEAKKEQVSFGPWYSQPDVFSALGETTIRNLEVGKKTIESLGLKVLKTAYLPDTFGFNKNLPQIFKKNGLDNFVHWRGLTKEQIKNFGIYEWEGIDGSIVTASNYNFGYYCLGQYYPYAWLTDANVNEKASFFLEKSKNIVKETFNSVPGDSILLPLGGDQAPAEHGITQFIKELNKLDEDYEWIVVNNFKEFFKEYEGIELPKIKGDLKTAIAGRIHRTIASARYDIKKLFRTNELMLFYKLEPLEFIYKQMDSSYDYDDYKLEQIIKPLLKLQAHDSLGGCNSDITNDDIVAKLLQISRRIKSIIDLIEYKIIKMNNHQYSDNVVNLINQFPEKRNIHKYMTIFSNHENIDKSTRDISIKTLSSKSIGQDAPIYEHQVFVKGKNIEPFKYKIVNLDEVTQKTKTIATEAKIEFIDDFIKVKTDRGESSFKFSVDIDDGDNYDYSPGEKLDYKQSHKLIREMNIDGTQIFEVESIVKTDTKLKINSRITIVDEMIDIDIFTLNKEIKRRVQIIFAGTNEVSSTTHLALTDFNEEDQTKNWKKDMVEYPVINDYSDGLIKMSGDGGYNIFVAGTNEFTKTEDGVSIVLYRTQKFTSSKELKWRPGRASGVKYNEETISSRLEKTLEFNFRITFSKAIKNLNIWNFGPIIHYKNSVHLTAHKMNKFEINEIMGKTTEISLPKIDVDNLVISKMLIKSEGSQEIRVANITNKKITSKVNDKVIKFKPFEYKNI